MIFATRIKELESQLAKAEAEKAELAEQNQALVSAITTGLSAEQSAPGAEPIVEANEPPKNAGPAGPGRTRSTWAKDFTKI